MESVSISIVDELLSLSSQSDELIADPPLFFEKFNEWVELIQKTAESILDGEPCNAMTLETFLFPGKHIAIGTTLSKLLIDNKSRIHTDSPEKSTSREGPRSTKERWLCEESLIKQPLCPGRQSSTQYSTKLSKKHQSVDHSKENAIGNIEPVEIVRSATPIENAQEKLSSDIAISHTPERVILNQPITRNTARSIVLPVAKHESCNKAEPASVVNSVASPVSESQKKTSNTASIAHAPVILTSASKDNDTREKRKSNEETTPHAAKKIKMVSSQPAINHVLPKFHTNVSATKDLKLAVNRTPIKMGSSKSKMLKSTPTVSSQEKENQGIAWEKIVEKNKQKIRLEQQQKIEESRRKRREKMQKLIENRMQIEKEKEERLRSHQKFNAKHNNEQKRPNNVPQKPVIDLTLKQTNQRKPEGPMPPKIPANTHLQPLNTNTLNKCPDLNTTYQACSGNPLNVTCTLSTNPNMVAPLHSTEYSKAIITDSPTSYDISEIPSDSEDEDDTPSEKPIPGWAKSVCLKNYVLREFSNPFDGDTFFGNTFPDLQLETMFGTPQQRYPIRTSSAIWDTSSQLH